MTPAPTTAHMSNFDPIPRLQQIVATIEDGGHFDSPATAAHYINCAIGEIERMRQEYGEARREIGDSLQTLIHLRQERDGLRAERDEYKDAFEFAHKEFHDALDDLAKMKAERDEARRLICDLSWEDSKEVARQMGWDCFKEEK